MAGIGWKLERMLERDTLGSTLQAYLTGVAELQSRLVPVLNAEALLASAELNVFEPA